MGEHYTKNTLEVTAWCSKCQRFTQHRVDGGRRGPCIECVAMAGELSKAQLERRKKAEEKRKQIGLFE